ncbi:40295_t:CDS:2 [Gigaspora margarita]|uniref:40295_t:CDS:1 n=1 Tax=Gigaspora margarita TaxID=4874 RepID=A0ABM8W0T6_GIGMA|nr:40295_t:CDS:2 [Gigaspora margarita]
MFVTHLWPGSSRSRGILNIFGLNNHNISNTIISKNQNKPEEEIDSAKIFARYMKNSDGDTSNKLEYCYTENTGRMNNARCYKNKIRQKDSSIIRNRTLDMKSRKVQNLGKRFPETVSDNENFFETT